MRKLLMLLLLAACVRETPDVSQNAPSRSSERPAQNPQATDTSVSNAAREVQTDVPTRTPAAPATADQRVELVEWAIRMPQSLPAGKHAFSVVNAGKETHSFEIEGNGVHASLPQNLPRGNSSRVEVELKPGTYTVYCPVDGHKGKGMSTTLVVQ